MKESYIENDSISGEYENSLRLTKEQEKDYDADDAIWIAAALLTWRSYKMDKIAARDDMYFKQAEITKLAAQYTKRDVDRAGCSWRCCADQEKSINNYLRGDYEKDRSARRLTMMEELKERTYPENLDPKAHLKMNGAEITVQELFDFVKNIYPTVYSHVANSEQISMQTETSAVLEKKLPKWEGANLRREEERLCRKKTKRWEAHKNLILYGPPGTGKTYESAIYAVAICDGKPMEEFDDYNAVMRRYRELKKEGRIAFTTFHPSYSYEEFVEGIKPVVDETKNNIGYTVEPGIFKKFCDKADSGNICKKMDDTFTGETANPYVFIIDEINRGNISKIFGELITLIENTKRGGEVEAVSAILPYSGTEFYVPENVYILGTMNTADRSTALMDTALRRRFQFIEMMPKPQVLRQLKADRVEDLDVAAMLEKINERLTFLYDREHTIGHAFFTGLRGENATLKHLQSIFEKSILPLLQEYFYEDYQKIQLVLGDNAKSSPDLKFIRDDLVAAGNIFKGNVEEIADYSEKVYSVNRAAFGRIESYKEIL